MINALSFAMLAIMSLEKSHQRQEVARMWTVIYIAPTGKIAERIRTKLTDEGFLVQVRPINMTKQQFEILVPEGELDEVQEILTTILHM
jgi:hypothetical protein